MGNVAKTTGPGVSVEWQAENKRQYGMTGTVGVTQTDREAHRRESRALPEKPAFHEARSSDVTNGRNEDNLSSTQPAQNYDLNPGIPRVDSCTSFHEPLCPTSQIGSTAPESTHSMRSEQTHPQPHNATPQHTALPLRQTAQDSHIDQPIPVKHHLGTLDTLQKLVDPERDIQGIKDTRAELENSSTSKIEQKIGVDTSPLSAPFAESHREITSRIFHDSAHNYDTITCGNYTLGYGDVGSSYNPGPWNASMCSHPGGQIGAGEACQLPSGGSNDQAGDENAIETQDADGDPSEEANASGFYCIYCSSDGAEDPTLHCRWPRTYISQLKTHHLNHKHPGGPFGCCRKCFSIGDTSANSPAFSRFTDKKQVEAHEENCRIYICIDESCLNYDQARDTEAPCSHESKHDSRQIWRMWYRRAHQLDGDEPVPEPHVPGPERAEHESLVITPATPDPRRRRLRPRLLTPSVSRRPSSQPSRLPGDGLTSPSLDPVTPSGSVRGPIHRTAQQVEGLAHSLLSRLTSVSPSWSGMLHNLHANTMPAAIRQLRGFSNTEPGVAIQFRNLFDLVGLCRRLLQNPDARDFEQWLDLTAAARTAIQVALPENPPRNWQPAMLMQHNDAVLHATQTSPQEQQQIGAHFNDVPTWSSYPLNMDMTGVGMSNNDAFNFGVQRRVQAQSSNLTYDQNPFTQPRYDQFLHPDVLAGTETQSTPSMPLDSGNFSGDGSTEYSGNGKAPAGRRMSVPANIRSGLQ